MKCPRCGAENYSGAKFCTTCGMALVSERPRPVSAVIHALFYVFVFFACQSFVTTGYMMSLMGQAVLVSDGVINQAALIEISEKVLGQTVMISLISNLMTILVVCLIQRVRRRRPADEFNLRPVNFFRCPTFLLFGVALNVFVSGTLSFLPFPEEIIEAFENQYASLYGDTPLALEIFSIAIVTAITEEIIFRGFVNSRLSRGMKTGAAVVLSSVIFGLAHGALIAVLYSALLGLVFSLMYQKFHSVLPSILCHAAFNATSYLLDGIGDRWFFPLYLISIAAVLFFAYRIFFRRPTFYDYVLDIVGEHKLRDDTEREILAEVRRMQEDGSISPDEIDRLAERWEENRRKYNKKSPHDTKSDDNNTKET